MEAIAVYAANYVKPTNTLWQDGEFLVVKAWDM
jgi:hypothetical protein